MKNKTFIIIIISFIVFSSGCGKPSVFGEDSITAFKKGDKLIVKVDKLYLYRLNLKRWIPSSQTIIKHTIVDYIGFPTLKKSYVHLNGHKVHSRLIKVQGTKFTGWVLDAGFKKIDKKNIKKGYIEYIKAMYDNDLDKLKILSINYPLNTEKANQFLIVVSTNNKPKLISYLLKKSLADPGNEGLLTAIENRNYSLITLLIKAFLKNKNSGKNTLSIPLFEIITAAIDSKDIHLLKHLHLSGLSLNKIFLSDMGSQYTFLHYALKNNNKKMALFLTTQGVSAKFLDMLIAVRRYDLIMVKYLINHGGSPKNLLIHAIRAGKFEIVKYLVETQKQDVNQFIPAGRYIPFDQTPYSVAKARGFNYIATYLKSKGAKDILNER